MQVGSYCFKFQNPKSKIQINYNQSINSKQIRFGIWSFNIIWSLEFGAWNLRRTARGGFTLIELLVSIGILAAVVSLSLANLRADNRARVVETEARQLVNVIRETEQRAVNGIDTPSGQALTSDERYALVIKGETYQTIVDSAATGALGVFDGNEKILSAHVLPAGINITMQPASDPTVIGFVAGVHGFVFNTKSCAYGGPNQSSRNLMIKLFNSVQEKEISLACLTGTISVE